MPPSAIIDRYDYWFTPGGSGVLRQVKDCTPSDEATLEPVIPEGSDTVTGSYSKPGPKYFELTCWPHTSPERDWQRFKRTRELCTFEYQGRGAGTIRGPRRQATVQVAEVTEPVEGSGGEYSYKVKLLVIGDIATVG